MSVIIGETALTCFCGNNATWCHLYVCKFCDFNHFNSSNNSSFVKCTHCILPFIPVANWLDNVSPHSSLLDSGTKSCWQQWRLLSTFFYLLFCVVYKLACCFVHNNSSITTITVRHEWGGWMFLVPTHLGCCCCWTRTEFCSSEQLQL